VSHITSQSNQFQFLIQHCLHSSRMEDEQLDSWPFRPWSRSEPYERPVNTTCSRLFTVLKTSEDFFDVWRCLLLLILCIWMTPISHSPAHRHVISLETRGGRQVKRIMRTLLAPGLLIFQTFIKLFEAHEDVKNARLIGIEQ
jgi:hypothetical protein